MSDIPAQDPWERRLRERLAAHFTASAQGADSPPGERLRLEGFAEAGLLLGLITPTALSGLLDEAHRAVTGHAIAECFPFAATDCVDAARTTLRIPASMQRAPVYPSTKLAY